MKRRVRARTVISSPAVTVWMRQGCVPGPYTERGQPASAVVPPRRGRVTSFAQQIRSAISWLSPLSPSKVPVPLGVSPFCLNVVSEITSLCKLEKFVLSTAFVDKTSFFND